MMWHNRNERIRPGNSSALVNVAIIIVTYKSASLTVECLRSIQAELASPGLSLRAIVIDNASGDFGQVSAAIQENHWSDWASCVLAPRNGGFAYGNNLGIRLAQSVRSNTYFYLLNPDTRLRAGAISTLVEFLEAHAAVGIAGGSFENLDGSDWPMAFRFPSLLSELNGGVQLGLMARLFPSSVVPRTMSKEAQPADWICGAAMMVRESVVAATGGLDESYFLYFEETDFCRRASLVGFPHLVCSREPGDAYLGTEHQRDGCFRRNAASATLLVRVPAALLHGHIRAPPGHGDRLGGHSGDIARAYQENHDAKIFGAFFLP